MRKLKLFFACLLMAVLSIGQVWADTPAAVGTTLFSEDFSSYSNTDVPNGSVTTGTGRLVYGSTNVTYTCADGTGTKAGTTKVTTDNSGNLAGGTSPELMVGKKGTSTGATGGSFSVAGIPSGGAQAITVSFKQNNQNLSVSVAGTGYTGSISGKPGAAGERTFDVTVDDGADATFTLTFQAAATSNVRVDDILVTVKTAGEGGAPATPTCAAPTFDPEDGETFTDNIDVEIAAESGTTIYYTTDGEDPTTSSDVYTTALNFTETTTLKAIATKTGSNNSAIATATYTKVVPFDGSILEITKGDFVASYASNNGDHVKEGVTYYTNQICLSSSSIQFQKSNGLLYNKTDLGNIAKIEITKTGDNNLIVYAGTAENPTSGEVTGSASGNKTTYTFASGKGFFAIKCSSTALSQVDPIKIYYYAPEIAAPTISGATLFTNTTTVTLECTADGASIYYTTDGTNPSSSSTLYEDPFELNASATVKAIAIKGTGSSTVSSKEFEKVTSYTTLAAIYAKALEVGSTATDIYVTFDSWKVSAKTSNNVFLTDGTNGAVIYGSGHGFNAGDVLTGTVACKVQLYKGFAELTSLNSGTAGLTVTAGSVGDPVVKTWDQLSAVNTGALVKLENLTYDGSSLSDGVNTIPTHTTFYTASFENGKSYNLTGVYQYYDTDGQILPRSAADIEEIIETFTVTYNNAPENGTLTIKNGDDVVASGSAVNEGTVLTIETTPAEDYKLAGVTVNGNAYTETTLELTENVTIAATFVENVAPVATLTLSENGVSAPMAGEHHQGDVVNLPLTSSAECVKDFVGWSANASCAVAPEYAPGAEYTLTSTEQTLYAVYATASGASYVKTALANIASGSEVVITELYSEDIYAAANDGGTSSGPAEIVLTETENVLNVGDNTNIFWIISKDGDNFSFTVKGGTDKLYCTNTNNGVRVGTNENNVFSIKSNYLYNNATLRYVGYNHQDGGLFRCYTSINSNINNETLAFYKKTATYSDYATTCVAALANPVFTPTAGVYPEAKNIVITAEEGTIYYTLDGTDPTSSSTEYTAPIVLDANGTTTIKAIAISATSQSAVVTATYTINLPLSTISAIFDAATSTQTEVSIKMGNWVVSGVGTDEKTVYVTDDTNGFIIYNSDHGFEVGDILSGTITCELKKYKGAAELIGVTTSTTGLTVTKGGTVTPASVAPADLAGVNTGALISLSSWKYDGSNLTNGTTEIQPYTTLYNFGETFVEDNYYNVSGIYLQFDSKKEILPRSAADIVPVELADPEISYTPASATIELGEDLPGTTFANPHDLTISYSSNNEAVATVTDAGGISLAGGLGTAVITASFAGNATYAAANVTYTITVNPASVSENVVILAVYNEKYYAMSTTIPSEAFTAIEVEYDGSKVTVNSEADKTAIQWTKKTSGENTTFQTKGETPMYMKGTSSGAAMSLNANVCNWSWDGTNEYYYIGSRSFFYQNGVGFKNYATSNFNKSGYSGKASVIVIDPANIVITSKANPQLAYTPAEVTLTVGDEFIPAVLSYAEGFDGLEAVTYASNNESVATVNESGVVSLVADATGTATITATFAGNSNYLAGNASYTITVNEVGDDLSGVWVLASSVAAGDKIIIGGTHQGVTKTMGKQNANNRAAVESSLAENVLAPGAATKVFTLVDAGDGKFAIQASNGKYLTSATTGTDNKLLEADDYENDNAKWTISIDGEGVASVIAAAGNKKDLQYNNSNVIFSCYTSGNQRPINIYKNTYTRNVTDGRYGTICLPYAGIISGAKLFDLEYYDGASTLYLLEVNGNAMEAGKPYIFLPSAEQISVTYTDAANAPAGNHNGLVGSYTQETITEGDGNYILYNNAYYLVNSLAYVGANRAYIHMGDVPTEPSTPQVGQAPRRRVGMTVNGEQVATGIGELNASETPVKMIIDGQLFIIRGEKMYNVNGQVVK